MFEDNLNYQKVLAIISKFQAYNISNTLSIPRMVIIGEQSSGKSSTLDAITHLPFPHGEGTCTRYPIQVTLRRDPTAETRTLTAYIKGQEDFNQHHAEGMSIDNFTGVIGEATAVLGTQTSHVSISASVLEITVTSKEEIPLILVDLPGFVETPMELQKTVQKINDDFIKDEKTIILAVVPANIDIDTSKSVRAALENDPNVKRTITIITHADCLGNKQTKEYDWVEKINLRFQQNPTNPYLVLANVRAGHGMPPLSWDASRLAEERFFTSSSPWSQIPAKLKGRVAVTKFLGEELYKHVCSDLPKISAGFETVLSDKRRSQVAIGATFDNIAEARAVLHRSITRLAKTYRNFMKGEYHMDYLELHTVQPNADPKNNPHFIRGPLSRWYEAYRDEMLDEWKRMKQSDILSLIPVFQAGALPGLLDSPLFKNLLKEKFLVPWRRITRSHLVAMHRHIANTVQYHIHSSAPPEIRKLAVHIYKRFAENRLQMLLEDITKIFLDESEPLAVNTKVLEMYYGSKDKPPVLTQGLTSGNGESTPATPGTPEPSSAANGRTPGQTSDRSSLSRTLSDRTTLDRITPDQSPDSSRHRKPESSPPGQTPANPWDDNNGTYRPSSQRQEQQQSQQQQQQQQATHSVYDERTAEKLVPLLNGFINFICDPLVNKILKDIIQRHMILEHHDDEFFDSLHDATDTEVETYMMDRTRHSQRIELDEEIRELEQMTTELIDIRFSV